MKPGLYVATIDGTPRIVTWRKGSYLDVDSGLYYMDDPGVRDLRPLVVLDPESAEDIREFALAYREAPTVSGSFFDTVQGALRALADPKPAEPTGLGAVVRDRKGATYVRVAVHFDGWAAGEMWRRVGGEVNADKRRAWSDIDVAEVLSEGWSE